MKLIPCIALGLFLASGVPVLAEDEEDPADDSKRCLNARSIRGVDVIDDNHVIFEIQGRRIYLNALPKSCVGLSRERRFSYETHTRSLCARDKIRILKEGGDRIYLGKSCSLGRFQPVTDEELVILFGKSNEPPEPEPTESADVEEVVNE